MLHLFNTFIKKENLFKSTDKILLTVSGGIDSVSMCELFFKAGFKFGIAHCNFQLRGAESDVDESFVEELAEKYNAQLHSVTFDTSSYSKKNKLSIQQAARELRYNWFEEIRSQYKYNFIATAHHRDDSIETFFINLIRGTGISGLHGILPKQGTIIRPLLFMSKDEILAFSKNNKLKHREDSSNASDKYLRNKIRLQLIPLLKELNPKINQTIIDEIKRFSNVEKIYKKEISAKQKKIVSEDLHSSRISIKELNRLNPVEPYLFEFLHPLGFNASTIEEIVFSLNEQSGKQFFSSTHRLIKDREHLIVEDIIKKKINSSAHKNKSYPVKKNQKSLKAADLKMSFSLKKTQEHLLKTSLNCANIDYDKLIFPLEIRKWKKGDSFYPLGMKGKKKLSDFFIDKKLSLIQKETIWLLTSENKIVWIIGLRIDERFKITDKTTKIYFAERL